MTEVRDPVRDVLEVMFRRREGDILVRPLGASTRRHVRRRQSAAVGLSVLAAVAIVTLAVTALPRPQPTPPLDMHGEARTSTVQGATITYPRDWYLVALPQTTTAWGDQTPPSAFRPVLQLTNFDPVDERLGRRWFCPEELSGRIPDDGVVLYVESIGGPIADDAPAWPVAFPTTGTDVRPGDGCVSSDGSVDTRWVADGVSYHAVVRGDAADPTVQAAFASMVFSGGTSAVPGEADGGPLKDAAYVLASYEGPAAWNLLGRPDTPPCFAVQVGDRHLEWGCEMFGPSDPLHPPLWLEAPEGTIVGGLGAEVTGVEDWRDDGETRPVPSFNLPPPFGDRRLFTLESSPGIGGSIAAFGADGLLWIRQYAIEPGGLRDPIASGAVRGSSWWVSTERRGAVLRIRLWASGEDDPTTASPVPGPFEAYLVPAHAPLVAFATDPFGPANDAFTTTVVVGVVPDGSASVRLEGHGHVVDLSEEGFVRLADGRTLFVVSIDATDGTVRAIDARGATIAEDRF